MARKKNSYMDRALRHSDRRYAAILGGLGYSTRHMEAEKPASKQAPEEDLTELRSLYQEVVGKRAYHGWDAKELKKRINEARKA